MKLKKSTIIILISIITILIITTACSPNNNQTITKNLINKSNLINETNSTNETNLMKENNSKENYQEKIIEKNKDNNIENESKLFDEEYLSKIQPKNLAENFQKGIIIGGMLWRPEEINWTEYNIKQIKQWGADYIIIIPEWFVENESSNEIKPFYANKGEFPNPTGWITPSLTDEEIKNIIHLAKKEELKVVLKPHIDPLNFGLKEGASRGALKPESWTKWYASYNKFISHFAKIAEEEKVNLLIIGTELDTATMSSLSDCCGAPKNATEEWNKIISNVRKIYHGKITYSVSCQIDDYSKEWKTQCHGPRDIEFWDKLDFIGFEPYFGLTNKNDPSIEELKQSFDERFNEWAKPLSEKYNKKIILTEVGYESSNGTNKKILSAVSNQVDHKEQADIYEALFESIAEKEYIIGTYFWAWYLQPINSTIKDWKEWQEKDLSNPFNGKLSGQVLRKWYGVN